MFQQPESPGNQESSDRHSDEVYRVLKPRFVRYELLQKAPRRGKATSRPTYGAPAMTNCLWTLPPSNPDEYVTETTA